MLFNRRKCHIAVGDLEKARQVYELSARAYPRDDGPFENLGELYNDLGQYDKALISDQEARRLNSDAINTPALAGVYLYLNRFEEAQSLVSDALAREPESYGLHFEMCFVLRCGSRNSWESSPSLNRSLESLRAHAL